MAETEIRSTEIDELCERIHFGPWPLDEIHEILDGVEWGSDTTDRITDVLTAAGYVIREPDDVEGAA